MDGPGLLDSAVDEWRPPRRRRLRGWWLLLVAAALVAGLAVVAVDVGGRITGTANSVRGGLGLDPPPLDPHAALYRAYARQQLTAGATTPQSSPPTDPFPATGRSTAAAADVPQQFGCLDDLWENESGWSPTARNPDSTAYGIAQFLDQTWTLMGVARTSDGYQQIDAGLSYIAQRYGTPCDAWTFWQQNHWY
jgi:hypothetical protein